MRDRRQGPALAYWLDAAEAKPEAPRAIRGNQSNFSFASPPDTMDNLPYRDGVPHPAMFAIHHGANRQRIISSRKWFCRHHIMPVTVGGNRQRLRGSISVSRLAAWKAATQPREVFVMTEGQVFLAVLDLANPADNTAYLEKAYRGMFSFVGRWKSCWPPTSKRLSAMSASGDTASRVARKDGSRRLGGRGEATSGIVPALPGIPAVFPAQKRGC